MIGHRTLVDPHTSLNLFTSTAQTVADDVIGAYSTSFGLATRLLGARHRTHVRNIYALVRVADEIVDGVAKQAGLTLQEQEEALDRYECDTHRAIRTGYSSDLIIHAFARTAIDSGIDESLTVPFFDSMRRDLRVDTDRPAGHDVDSHATYVYGSAEVIGLMCLRVFVRGMTLTHNERETLEHGAKRLGAAFQNINFLRDLADDTERLGRNYLTPEGRLNDADRDRWLLEIRAQLADAKASIPLLPVDARAAVRSAHALFAELAARISRTPAADLYKTRIRVPNAVKMALASRALMMTTLETR